MYSFVKNEIGLATKIMKWSKEKLRENMLSSYEDSEKCEIQSTSQKLMERRWRH